MKKLLLLLMVVMVVLPFGAYHAAGQAGDYVLVFQDEFDLPDGSMPDTSKWRVCKRYYEGWSRWVSKSSKVLYVKNGKLVMKCLPNRNLSPDTARMLTAAVESADRFAFQYGKVEVRMKTNNRRGNQSAVWMKPAIDYPAIYGEMDIVETCGDLGVAQQTVHSRQSVEFKKQTRQNAFRTPIGLSRWHVYGVEWTPSQITYTIDGKVTGTYRKSNDATDLAEGQWTFDRPFFLLLTQSLGSGKVDCMVPNLQKTYEMQIDWIRVYRNNI